MSSFNSILTFSLGVLFLGARLDGPNPSCYVCSKHMLSVVVNTEKMLLRTLVEEVIKKKINMTSPMVGMGNAILVGILTLFFLLFFFSFHVFHFFSFII